MRATSIGGPLSLVVVVVVIVASAIAAAQQMIPLAAPAPAAPTSRGSVGTAPSGVAGAPAGGSTTAGQPVVLQGGPAATGGVDSVGGVGSGTAAPPPGAGAANQEEGIGAPQAPGFAPIGGAGATGPSSATGPVGPSGPLGPDGGAGAGSPIGTPAAGGGGGVPEQPGGTPVTGGGTGGTMMTPDNRERCLYMLDTVHERAAPFAAGRSAYDFPDACGR